MLVLGGIDFDLQGVALTALAEKLDDYPHRFTRRPNRGLDSGRDLDGDGRLGGPVDAEGYGTFAGQSGMAVLSRLPIDIGNIADFTDFAWRDLPGNLALNDGRDPMRLSTTVHWDVPVTLSNGIALHLLIWHATAPVFDGPEDRNGRRNHDEARFWQLYLDGGLPFEPPDAFVLLGTANSDPQDGDSRPEALLSILNHPKLQDPRPASDGAVAASQRDGGVNASQVAPPQLDTADWPDADGSPGNLRVDYVLPSSRLRVVDRGVFWPDPDTPLGRDAALASRHRLVWLDIEMGDRRADRR